MRIFIYLSIVFYLFFFHPPLQAKTDTLVIINTNYGVIKLKLYEETPTHRHNFIKLATNGFYDSLLFHRVISGFMLQGGDPESKRANSSAQLGQGDIGYTLSAEINPSYFHKKGALAAARQGDDVNPEHRSSGCQFYIVQGKKFSELDMLAVESRMLKQLNQSLILKYIGKPENSSLKARYLAHQQDRNSDSLSAINKQIQPFLDADLKNQKPHKFSMEEKKIYSTIGGAPHLDGNYTVFGEVIEGIEVIDRIAEIEVSEYSRPKIDIRMRINIEVVNSQ
jgi:peptidylprolyl isomerase